VPRSEWRARAIDTNDIRGNRFDEVVTSLRRSGQIDINDNQVTIGSGKEFGIEM
jgi:DNA-directed RNA polymerase subunit K/omega